MRLQHDNTRPHSSWSTSLHIAEMNIRLLEQPAYSSDCNLSDRIVFSRLEALRKDFDNREQLEQFLKEQLPHFTDDRINKALEDLVNHMEKVVEKRGSYIVN